METPVFQGSIGVARGNITPPPGIYARNWGAAQHDVADGVHRPLTLTALTLQGEDTGPPLVLAVADLGWWRSAADEWAVRSAVLQALNLPASHLLLCFTHTHAGPALCREDADRPGGDLIAPYLEHLTRTTIATIQQARDTATPATLQWASGKCDLAQNRDLPDPNGTRYLSGHNPAAIADDTLLVGRVVDLAEKTRATLVNYACHPTTLAWENRLLSPDYIGAMRETIETQTDKAPCLFLLGACGELAPAEQYTADTAVADIHGRRLGYAALSVLEGMEPPGTRCVFGGVVESGAPLALWQRVPQEPSRVCGALQTEVTLPLQSMPTLAELETQIAACTDRAVHERLLRKRRIRQGVGDGQTTRMPLWTWRIGETFLVAQPNEAYSLLQTALRRRFASHPVVVINVANGHFGYLPPEPLYDYDLYPVWQTPFGRGSLEHLISEADAAIHSLT